MLEDCQQSQQQDKRNSENEDDSLKAPDVARLDQGALVGLVLAFERGILFLGAGVNSIRIAPPLIVTKEQADIAMELSTQCTAAFTGKCTMTFSTIIRTHRPI